MIYNDENSYPCIDVQFAKVRAVKSPAVGTPGSAVIDLFVPDDFKTIDLLPNQSVLIPSGLKFKMPAGWGLAAYNKSGVATKKSLIKGAELIDNDYHLGSKCNFYAKV